MEILISVATTLLNAYQFMIFAYIILRWFPEFQNNKFAEILYKAVDPFLAIFRGMIPPIGGIDLSVMLALILLQIATAGLALW